jgi:catechol 2,3-dioxygenase-like lactoylglutathione lyase family enzyme
MAGTTIGGFELTVRDIEAAERFYTECLGLTVRDREDHQIFQETLLVGEGDRTALILVTPRDPDAPLAPAAESAKVLLIMDDVRALHAAALDGGATEISAPQLYEALDLWFSELRDLEGYTVQLVGRHGPNATDG